MINVFSQIQTAARKRAAYNRTVAELSALPIQSRLDLDIYAGDIRDIARRAVYG